jgi:hypothetical protein
MDSGVPYRKQDDTFPKEKTAVFFNIDMAGNGTGLSVGGG